MAITRRTETRNLRVASYNEENREVLVCSAHYGTSNVSFQCEFLDKDYCAENHNDVQAAISDFLFLLNGHLATAKLPVIQPEELA